MGIAILGDFNRTEIRPICRAHALSQVVNKPTRENAILDLIMTNVKHFYDDPSVSSPVGSSDHVTIYWSPKHGYRIESSVQKRSIRPLLKSRIHEFGRWITNHSWQEVLSVMSTQDKADAFYSAINSAIETHFPTKVSKFIPVTSPGLLLKSKPSSENAKLPSRKRKLTCGGSLEIK